MKGSYLRWRQLFVVRVYIMNCVLTVGWRHFSIFKTDVSGHQPKSTVCCIKKNVSVNSWNLHRFCYSFRTFSNFWLIVFRFIFFISTGYVVVPAGGGGTFLGGVLVRMLKLKVRGIIRMCLILSLILLPLLLIFLLRCQNNRFVGISVPYNAPNRLVFTVVL